jgi:hypothetical protein
LPDTDTGTASPAAAGTPVETAIAGRGDADDYASVRAAGKAQTRCEISRSARRLFLEYGFDAVTVADIAAAASVSAQTVYNHFATKEELFFEAARTGSTAPPRPCAPESPALLRSGPCATT